VSLPLTDNLISGQVHFERGDGEATEAEEPMHRGSGELALDAAHVLDVPLRFLYEKKRATQIYCD